MLNMGTKHTTVLLHVYITTTLLVHYHEFKHSNVVTRHARCFNIKTQARQRERERSSTGKHDVLDYVCNKRLHMVTLSNAQVYVR